MIRGTAAIMLAATAVLAGCGSDDSVSPAPGAQGAEQRVREFMTAEYEGDADTACGYVSEELATALDKEVASCETLVVAQSGLADAGEAKFEDRPITAEEVAELSFETRLGEGDTTATVTGPRGEQSFELEVVDGEWTLTGIPGTTT